MNKEACLACCSLRGHKESDTTEQINWTELNRMLNIMVVFGHRTFCFSTSFLFHTFSPFLLTPCSFCRWWCRFFFSSLLLLKKKELYSSITLIHPAWFCWLLFIVSLSPHVVGLCHSTEIDKIPMASSFLWLPLLSSSYFISTDFIPIPPLFPHLLNTSLSFHFSGSLHNLLPGKISQLLPTSEVWFFFWAP